MLLSGVGVMSPQRVQAFTSAAAQSTRSASHTATEPVAAALAGGFGVFGALFSVDVVILGGILIFFMILDLISGALTAIKNPLQDFEKPKLYGGVVGKLLLLIVPFVAAGLDIVLALAVHDTALSALAETGLLSTSAIVLLIVAEAVSILGNVNRSAGGRVAAIAWLFRAIDAVRWAQKHPDDDQPARRSYDAKARHAEQRMTEQARDVSP